MESLIQKIRRKSGIVIVGGSLIAMSYGCETTSPGAGMGLLSVISGGNAQLAQNQRQAVGWGMLSQLAGSQAEHERRMAEAEAGRSQINIYNQNQERQLEEQRMRARENEQRRRAIDERNKRPFGVELADPRFSTAYLHWEDKEPMGVFEYGEMIGVGRKIYLPNIKSFYVASSIVGHQGELTRITLFKDRKAVKRVPGGKIGHENSIINYKLNSDEIDSLIGGGGKCRVVFELYNPLSNESKVFDVYDLEIEGRKDIIRGKTPYSTAFIDVVDIHNDPDVNWPDELKGRGNEIMYGEVNRIGCSSLFENKNGQLAKAYMCNPDSKRVIAEGTWIKIDRENYVIRNYFEKEQLENVNGKVRIMWGIKNENEEGPGTLYDEYEVFLRK